MKNPPTLDDALALLSPNAPGVNLGTSAENATDRALAQQAADRSRTSQRLAAERYVTANAQPGVPFDTSSGLPFALRAKMSFERDPAKQSAWLAQQPGVMGTRLTNDQAVVARMAGPDGRPRDILADERGIALGDVADLAGDVPAAAVGAGTAYLTGGMSLLPQALTVAGTTAFAGGLQDAMIRRSAGNDIDPAEIAIARGTGAAIDTVMPLIPAGVKRATQLLIGKSSFRGPLEIEAEKAVQRLHASTGVPVELSAAQASGNPMFARAEVFSQRLPLAGPLNKQSAEQEAAVREIQNFILGGDAALVPSSESIANKTGKILAEGRTLAGKEVTRAGRAAESAAQRDISALLDAQIVPSNVTISDAGAALRGRAVKLRDEFKAQAGRLYDEVYNAAGGNAVTVPMGRVTATLNQIAKDAPEAAGLLFPEMHRLAGIAEKLPADMPLQQARELRTLVNDFLGRPEAMPGVPERYLAKLRDSLTEAIDLAAKNAPDKTLGAKLTAANQFYRAGARRFEQKGIADLFRDASAAGFVDDSAIARRLFAGGGDTDTLKKLRDVFGAGSTEYRTLIRANVNELMDRARFSADFIRADDFLGNLQALNPEFRREILGAAEKEIVGNAQVMRIAQGAKVSADDLERVLTATPGQAALKLRAMVDKQKAIDQFYGKKLVRQLMDGQFSPSSFNPDEFVARFVDNAGASEVRQVMTKLRAVDPGLPDQIKRRTMLNLLERSEKGIQPDQFATGVEKLGGFDLGKLAVELRGKYEKYATLLGKDTMQNLSDLMVVQATREKTKQAGSMAGQIVSSTILASLTSGNLRELPRIAKNRVIAGILTNPATKHFAKGLVDIPDTPRARLAIMASPPVIRAIVEEFRDEPDMLGQVLEAIRMSPDARERRKAPTLEDAMRLLN